MPVMKVAQANIRPRMPRLIPRGRIRRGLVGCPHHLNSRSANQVRWRLSRSPMPLVRESVRPLRKRPFTRPINASVGHGLSKTRGRSPRVNIRGACGSPSLAQYRWVTKDSGHTRVMMSPLLSCSGVIASNKILSPRRSNGDMLLLLISSRGVSPRSRLLRSKEAIMGASMSTIARILRDEDEFWLFFQAN